MPKTRSDGLFRRLASLCQSLRKLVRARGKNAQKVKFVQKVHITPVTIQLKKEPLLHGAARHVATMLDQVVPAQRATVPHARQDAMMLELQDAMTQAVAVPVLPDPKVGAPKVTDQHAHQDATMHAHHDVMIDQADHVQVVHAQKVTDQHARQDAMMLVHHDVMTDQADHDAMIDQVVHAPKVTDQVASGRAGPVRQMIARHAEDQRVHVVIPTSLRVLKQQKNVNR